ncbi:DUF2075 domain-containing protein [Aerococcaceae bacterium WGS1372]
MSSIIIEHHAFDKNELPKIESVYLNNYPIVYIIHNQSESKRSSKAYIGQTVHAQRRIRNHLDDKCRKDLTDTLLIGHESFNQSATYNIETNLINYFLADGQFELQNVSQTLQNQTHNYYQKDYYHTELFEELWEELRKRQLVKDSTDVLKNKDIYKLSPFKELSAEQLELKNKILNYCKKHIAEEKEDNHHVFIVHGEAGTGKSVVLSSLFNTIQEMTKAKETPLSKTDNYLLVNHTEMQKTYQNMAGNLPHLQKNRFEKPTTFINKYKKVDKQADIVLVDEAHLLLSTADNYNNFREDNHLEEIIKLSKITVIIFDEKQVLKMKSHWSTDLLESIIGEYPVTEYTLTNQFRMMASPEIVHWVDSFVQKQLVDLPFSTDNFDLRVVQHGADLRDYIQDANNKVGLSRIVSTFDYKHKKKQDGTTYYVDEDGLNMPWNTTDSSLTWAERPETINEVGSIYTIQGFDLNFVGVVLGPSVDYDENKNELVIHVDKYQDVGGFSGSNRFDNKEDQRLYKERIILNSINVLMKRGVHGLAIYAVNPKLKNKLLQLQEERTQRQRKEMN